MNPDPHIAELILERFPVTGDFRFLDRITQLDLVSITGEYTFRPDLAFYADHFAGKPLTPGSILAECCAQITILAYGLSVFLRNQLPDAPQNSELDLASEEVFPLEFFLVRTRLDFLQPVYPGTRVVVHGQKSRLRFGRLGMNVTMRDQDDQLICTGQLEGQYRLMNQRNG